MHCPKISTIPLYFLLKCLKDAGWMAKSAEEDQMPYSAAYDLGLHFCWGLTISILQVIMVYLKANSADPDQSFTAVWSVSSLLAPTTMSKYIGHSTLSSLQTNTDTFANSEDLDETAHYQLSHLDLHCLPFCYWLLTETLFATMDVSKFWDGRVHFRNGGEKIKACRINTWNKIGLFLNNKLTLIIYVKAISINP